MLKSMAAIAALALCSTSGLASTILLTSDPHTGTTTTFTTTGSQGFGNPGPVTLNGFVVTGNPQVTYGNTSYDITPNGVWNNFSWIATNSFGAITFNLGGAYSLVGGFLNYAPGYGADATITALGVNGTTVLGTYDLETLAAISTPGGVNAGAFRGIQSTANDIGYFRISGDYALIHSLEVGTTGAPPSTVPEPSTLLLLGTGMAGATGVMRRRLGL